MGEIRSMLIGRLSATILVIEDDPGHARLIEKNLRRSGLQDEIKSLKDGQEAMDVIFGHSAPEIWDRPLMVLLDLNLPTYSGMQILERMKSTPGVRQVPVVVLTTTDDPREIERCYQLGCNVYITKPVDYERFSDAIRKLGTFLKVISLPTREHETYEYDGSFIYGR